MRGVFFIIMLIVLLIAGMLVVKNLSTETVGKTEKIEAVQKARNTTETVNEKTREIMDRLQKATQ